MNNAVNAARRRWVAGACAAGTLAPWASLSLAAGRAKPGAPAEGGERVVMVVLRGGLDGLSAVPAVGDPAFAAARGPLSEFAGNPLALDGHFALHPRLVRLHGLYGSGELAVVQAVGLAYHDRSHFDAQQVLESGGTRPHELVTGWLGRALGASRQAKGLALDTTVPLTLRGRARIDTWAPATLPEPGPDLVARLARLYADDLQLGAALERAKALHADGAGMSDAAGGKAARAGGFTVLAQRAAAFLAEPAGPQAAVLELSGWDTHANQANPNGALARLLGQLDTGLGALRDDLVASGTWARTTVVVATEFGREVAVNGTLGTDHGSGGAAFVLGGGVQGGRVITDWPGLAKGQRFEGRDLRTTTDLRAVLKGAMSAGLRDQLGFSERTLNQVVFPGSDAVKGLRLMRA